MVFAWVSLAIVMRIRHTRALALSMVMGCVLLSALAFAGSCPPPRPRWLEAMFRSTIVLPFPDTMGYLVLVQMAVQLYPTTTSMTGSALIMGCYRFAGICAPIVFEASRGVAAADDDETWTLFFYCTGAVLGLGAVLMEAVSRADLCDTGAAEAILPGKAAALNACGGYGATASRT